MKNIYIYIAIGVVALTVAALAIILGKSGGVGISTDKLEYAPGDSQIVSIKNDFGKTICFSSCYPYRLEKRDAEWEAYEYDECPDEDVVDVCIGQSGIKKFKIALDEAEAGVHRISIGVCVDCGIGAPFKEDKIFYSNSFEVK